MSNSLTEDDIELAALEVLQELGYKIAYGPDISPDGKFSERELYSDIVLVERLRNAIYKLNPEIPPTAKEEAVKKVLRTESPHLLVNNERFHNMLVNGVNVEYRKGEGTVHDIVHLFDFEDPENNDFLAVNQFTVIENNNNRRPDIVLFVNGLPLAVIELKNPVDEKATIKKAFNQIETYKEQIPSLFQFNEILVISDGIEARAGTITSKWERFMPWKTIEGEKEAIKVMPQMDVLFRGMFQKEVLLDLIRHFIVFEKEKNKTDKKIAAYHQYHAVNRAINATIKASSPHGDKRCGVIWHTQGSGKSLIMAFYTGKLVLSLDNPTIVVITDRNDLDDQLFGTFSSCQDLLRQKPVQADSREHLQELLVVSSGGVVFTTIQKFFPEKKGEKYLMLSDRRNIVVIADEAHRSQYDFIDGFARHMRDALPNASFIGFTGTPLERGDKNTVNVFGNYIDIYDIEQAVEDGATVRIFYEGRLAKLEFIEDKRPTIDPDFEYVTEGEEITRKEKLKSKWARFEAIVGNEKRIKRVARDIVDHFEKRLEAMEGKGMIVCMSRRICVELCNEIIKLKPEWEDEDDTKGFLKVVMTGSAGDPVKWQQHIRTKQRRKELGDLFKDPDTDFKLVIVRDMWLTGFDVPSLHTMYIDKPMKGHGLMQTIARVNRVYKDKPGGLIVDYLGIAAELKNALSEYTESGGKGKPALDQEEAVAVMLEKYEIMQNMFFNFNYDGYFTAKVLEKMWIIRSAEEHILAQDDGEKRFLKYIGELSKAFSLAVPHQKALEIRDDVGFFQDVKANLAKFSTDPEKSGEELDSAIRQIISGTIVSDKVIDIFEAAGIKKPDISILSDEFLLEVKSMEHKNLAVELLKKLLNDEIRTRKRKNVIEARSFAEMLEKSIIRYNNKSIDVINVIDELIEIAKKMREARDRGKELNLTEYEVAFYDALGVNDSAVKVLGDKTLREIAIELAKTIRNNITIDWTLRENVQAKLRVAVKRILRAHGYPPDKQKKAVDTVLEQANLICKNLAEAK
ncbi:MAG: type I restriction endonuclease subunit R [Bacteroidota bacterium]